MQFKESSAQFSQIATDIIIIISSSIISSSSIIIITISSNNNYCCYALMLLLLLLLLWILLSLSDTAKDIAFLQTQVNSKEFSLGQAASEAT